MFFTIFTILSPEKQGAPGGATQVPLSLLSGQCPRQKQVKPSPSALSCITESYSEIFTDLRTKLRIFELQDHNTSLTKYLSTKSRHFLLQAMCSADRLGGAGNKFNWEDLVLAQVPGMLLSTWCHYGWAGLTWPWSVVTGQIAHV